MIRANIRFVRMHARNPDGTLLFRADCQWWGDYVEGGTIGGDITAGVNVPDPIPLLTPSLHQRILTAVRDTIRAQPGVVSFETSQIASANHDYQGLL